MADKTMKDYAKVKTNHEEDNFETVTMLVSVGLAASFLIILLIGGAYL